MGESVNNHLAGYLVADARSTVVDKEETVVGVFLNKTHQQVVTLYQIGLYDKTVVVAVRVFVAENCIGLVCGQAGKYCLVFAKQEDSGKVETFFARHQVFFVKTRASKKLHFVHILPRMTVVFENCKPFYRGYQIHTQMVGGNVWEYLALVECVRLAVDNVSHHIHRLCDVLVGIAVAVKYFVVAKLEFGIHGHIYPKDCFAVIFSLFQVEKHRRTYFVGIVERVDKILFDMLHGIRLHTRHCSVVVDTEQYESAITV